METITVRHEHDDHFHIDIRHHGFVVDQPERDGGNDLGPTPTELFVASLASCVAHYARRYFARHGVDPAGFTVDCDFEMSTDRPARVSLIDIAVNLPGGVTPEMRPALQRVVEHCTVHNSMRIPPAVRIALTDAEQVA